MFWASVCIGIETERAVTYVEWSNKDFEKRQIIIRPQLCKLDVMIVHPFYMGAIAIVPIELSIQCFM